MKCELFNEAFAGNSSKTDNDSHLLICNPMQNMNSGTLNISIDEPIVLKNLLKLEDSTPDLDGIPSVL